MVLKHLNEAIHSYILIQVILALDCMRITSFRLVWAHGLHIEILSQRTRKQPNSVCVCVCVHVCVHVEWNEGLTEWILAGMFP